MSIIPRGFTGTVEDVDGTTFRAKRTTVRPPEMQQLGHYRTVSVVGLVAASAANGRRWAFRWNDPARVCVPTFLGMRFQQTSATATAALLNIRFEMYQLRFDTKAVAGIGIGQALLTGSKKRTKHGVEVASIFDSNSAAGMTGLSGEFDLVPLMQLQAHVLATAPTAQPYQVYEQSIDPQEQEHPPVLAENDALVVIGPTTVFGAAGTANLLVDIAWAEGLTL